MAEYGHQMIESATAKTAEHNSALATYDFGWLWNELGLDKVRR
jgi:hypothetical protein